MNFKIGDLVKRIADPVFDYRYMKSGGVYQITGLPEDDSTSLQVNNDEDCYWMKSMFELYQPEEPAIESELEEAYAKIESLGSALEDAVRELILLRSGNHALLGAALTLTSLHTGNNTAVIDVNQGEFKPIKEMTLEDWELAKELGWVFLTGEGCSVNVVQIDYDPETNLPLLLSDGCWFSLSGEWSNFKNSDYNVVERIK